jgi:hypothetical protein
VHEAARGELDPDRRIIAMLGVRGKAVAKTQAAEKETQASA